MSEKKQSKTKRTIISIFLIALGIGLVGAGIIRQEAETVFEKATRICMECIGLG